MRVLRLVDVFFDRAGLWPRIVMAALMAASAVTGILGQVWSISPWFQLAIFAGTVLLAIWVLARVLKWAVRPSPQDVQGQIHSLWTRGKVLLESGTTTDSPNWATWRDGVVAFYARWASAEDRAWLDGALVAGHDTKSGMAGLLELSRRMYRP
jgi:hypothetical protein